MRDRLAEIYHKIEIEYLDYLTNIAERAIDNDFEDKIQKRQDFYVDKLLANGVIVPPCKVGDVVWVVFTPKYPADPNDKGKWFMKQDGVERIIYGAKGLSIETWNMGTIPAKEIGKKLFFVKEEAGRALKEREQKG